MKFRAILVLLMAGSAWAQGVITTYAGANWVFPGAGKPAINAPLGIVYGATLDPAGNVVIADYGNWLVERINPDGKLAVIAGNGLYFVFQHTGDGGSALRANIYDCLGVAYDLQGNLYIAESDRISRVSTQGIINTIAGGGTDASGEGITALSVALSPGYGLVVDPTGVVYFSEPANNRVRKLALDGTITTVAGTGIAGSAGDNGPAALAQLNYPVGIALDNGGNLYIADSGNAALRKVTPAGQISTPFHGFPMTGVAVDNNGALYIAGYGAVYKVAPGASNGTLIAGRTPASGYNGGFSGDGGPALGALFSQFMSVVADNFGNVYIGDVNNMRIRKVSAGGTVTTIAGNGQYFYTGEGVSAATAPILYGGDVAVDKAGNVYHSEPGTARIRKISGGVITTVAGSGVGGFSGDGGPAVQATIFNPRDMAFDAANNLYIADSYNGRVRRVAQDGTISTFVALPGLVWGLAFDSAGNLYASLADLSIVYRIDSKGNRTVVAGTGTSGYSGDGGQATAAKLNGPAGLAVDGSGNLYIADSQNGRVRKVTPQGVITSILAPTSPGENPQPVELALDSAGNLYVSDESEAVVRKIAANGGASIFAGGGEVYPGDGKPANQVFLYNFGIATDTSGNLYIDDAGIKIVLAVPPSISLQQNSLSFTAASGTAPVTQTTIILGSVPGLEFTVSATTATGGNWLSASDASAATPDLLAITADPSNLAPGNYTGTITIHPLAATPAALTINVSFTVGAALPPQISVDQTNLSFTYPKGAPARSVGLKVSNVGGGALGFTVTTTTNTGGSWLSATPAAGSVSPGVPVTLTVTADPSKLGPGNYTGSVVIQSNGGGSVSLPVNMGISSLSTALLLTQTGMSFTAVAQGGVVPPQSFGVVNLGTGALNWTASASTLAGGTWLSVTPTSGASDPTLGAPQVTVSVNPNGLAAGAYYGLVTIVAPGAANTPQVVSVFLTVLAAGSDPGASVQPSELFFSATAKADPSTGPGSQDLLIYNIGATPKSYFLGFPGEPDFAVATLPGTATLDPNQPTRVVVLPYGEFPAGSFTDVVNFQFSDGRVQTVKFHVIAGGGATGGAKGNLRPETTAAACVPKTLIPALTTLSPAFTVSAGYPTALSVQVKDDCGNAHVAGHVTVAFTNGDPQLGLISLNNGIWQNTWPTGAQSAGKPVHVIITADNPDQQINGTLEVDGSVSAANDKPVVAGVVSAATFAPYTAAAPGSIISIFGSRLADNLASAQNIPLPTTLGNAVVRIGGILAPLFFTSDGQVNAAVPFGLNTNTTQQMYIQRDGTVSSPVAINVADAQPGAFVYNGSAIVQDFRGTAAPFLVSPTAPAQADDVLVFYCGGLGLATQPVMDGAASPSAPTQGTVTAVIGGKNAQVLYSGLVQGLVGLYQVNLRMPGGVTPGSSVPVVLTIAGQTSPMTSVAAQ